MSKIRIRGEVCPIESRTSVHNAKTIYNSGATWQKQVLTLLAGQDERDAAPHVVLAG